MEKTSASRELFSSYEKTSGVIDRVHSDDDMIDYVAYVSFTLSMKDDPRRASSSFLSVEEFCKRALKEAIQCFSMKALATCSIVLKEFFCFEAAVTCLLAIRVADRGSSHLKYLESLRSFEMSDNGDDASDDPSNDSPFESNGELDSRRSSNVSNVSCYNELCDLYVSARDTYVDCCFLTHMVDFFDENESRTSKQRTSYRFVGNMTPFPIFKRSSLEIDAKTASSWVKRIVSNVSKEIANNRYYDARCVPISERALFGMRRRCFFYVYDAEIRRTYEREVRTFLHEKRNERERWSRIKKNAELQRLLKNFEKITLIKKNEADDDNNIKNDPKDGKKPKQVVFHINAISVTTSIDRSKGLFVKKDEKVLSNGSQRPVETTTTTTTTTTTPPHVIVKNRTQSLKKSKHVRVVKNGDGDERVKTTVEKGRRDTSDESLDDDYKRYMTKELSASTTSSSSSTVAKSKIPVVSSSSSLLSSNSLVNNHHQKKPPTASVSQKREAYKKFGGKNSPRQHIRSSHNHGPSSSSSSSNTEGMSTIQSSFEEESRREECEEDEHSSTFKRIKKKASIRRLWNAEANLSIDAPSTHDSRSGEEDEIKTSKVPSSVIERDHCEKKKRRKRSVSVNDLKASTNKR